MNSMMLHIVASGGNDERNNSVANKLPRVSEGAVFSGCRRGCVILQVAVLTIGVTGLTASGSCREWEITQPQVNDPELLTP